MQKVLDSKGVSGTVAVQMCGKSTGQRVRPAFQLLAPLLNSHITLAEFHFFKTYFSSLQNVVKNFLPFLFTVIVIQ